LAASRKGGLADAEGGYGGVGRHVGVVCTADLGEDLGEFLREFLVLVPGSVAEDRQGGGRLVVLAAVLQGFLVVAATLG